MQRLLPLQPGVAQSYDFLTTNDMSSVDQVRNIGFANQKMRSTGRSETCTSSSAAAAVAHGDDSSSLDISKLLDLTEPKIFEEKSSGEEVSFEDDAQSISNDPGIQSLLDLSLPSPIPGSSRDSNDGCSYSDFTDSSSQPPMSPMRILRELPCPADAKWFEENMHDFSLSSFLGHLDQSCDQNLRRIRSPSRHVSEARSVRDLRLLTLSFLQAESSNMSTISESSIDYISKFEELAESMKNDANNALMQ